MNTEIAEKRYKDVLRVDVTTDTQGDFLATHVPFRNLHIARELTPDLKLSDEDRKKDFTEEEVYDQLVRPVEDDQFTLVIGTNGSGKSHLIRWLATMLENREKDREAVLFVRRNDNTLKGTIKQLLAMPEVQNIPNKDELDKLTKAASTVREDVLKDMIYHNFIIDADNDEEGTGSVNNINNENNERLISRSDRKHLIALMNNEEFKSRKMMNEDGPVERIYSKFAESSTVRGSNVVAQFKPEDFLLDYDLIENLDTNADRKAAKLADQLIDSDDLSRKKAEQISHYLNCFTDDVIHKCAGLQPGDLNQIFTQIRQEIKRQGKNLTILVEDVTSFTGVNSELLEALMTPHTGEYAKDNICRINAIVGSTDGYYHDNFRSNYRQRINHFIWVPNDIFGKDKKRLFGFFARYLNAMSLPESTIKDWALNGAQSSSYPIHEMTDGANWDQYTFENGSKVSLYPFSQRAIQYLYDGLSLNDKTPRVVMQKIILPNVEDILFNKNSFPSHYIDLRDGNISLRAKLSAHITDENELQRTLRFMTVWGDGTNDTYEKKNIRYIGGIPESIYEELNIRVVSGKEAVSTPRTLKVPEPETPYDAEEQVITAAQKSKLQSAANELSKWVGNPQYRLNFAASTASVVLLYHARRNINDYLYDVIDWLSEGVSIDEVNKIYGQNRSLFVSFERETQKSTSVYVLPANNDSLMLLDAFIRWEVLGNGSWNFDGGTDCLLRVMTWTDSIRPAIVKAVRDVADHTPSRYFSYSTAADMYRLILNGTYKKYTDPTNIAPESLLIKFSADGMTNGHGVLWNNLLKHLNEQTGEEDHSIVLQYYNLPQGTAKKSEIYVLDRVEFEKAVRKVRNTGLHFTDVDLQLDDPRKSRRKSSDNLKYILERVDKVVTDEKAALKTLLDQISTNLDLDEIESDEDIEDIIDDISAFYNQAENSRISVYLHKNTLKIIPMKKARAAIYSALRIAQDIMKTEDNVVCLLKLSNDPAQQLKTFAELLEQVSIDVEKAKSETESRMKEIGAGPEEESGQYSEANFELEECRKILEEEKDNAD